MRTRSGRLPWWLMVGLAGWLVGGVAPAAGQIPLPQPVREVLADVSGNGEGGGEGGEEEAAGPALPGSHEVIPRARALMDEADEAEAEAAELSDLGALEERVAEARRSGETLRRMVEQATSGGYLRERSSGIHEQALRQERHLEELVAEVGRRLEALEKLRGEWVEKRRFWRAWREELRGQPEFETLGREARQALNRVEKARGEVTAAFQPLLELQRELEGLESANRDILERAERIRRQRREALLRRDAPGLLSPEFFRQLRGVKPDDVRRGIASAPRVPRRYLEDHAGLLALQLLVILGVGLVARRLRRAGGGKRELRVLAHPWAIGVFVALTTLGYFYQPMPLLWELVGWLLVAASGALLASGMFRNPRKRFMVYVLALFYPLFFACEVFALPEPLFRLLLAAVALGGAPLLAWLARRRGAEPPVAGGEPGAESTDGTEEAEEEEGGRHGRGFCLLLWAGGALLAVALGGEILGFDNLSRWLIQAAVTTAFTVFVATFLARLGRGGLRELMARRLPGRLAVLQERLGDRLTRHVGWLIQAVVVVTAALYVLDVWEVASPVEAWEGVMGFGFSVGSFAITVERVLLVAVTLYLAVAASRLTRALLDTEVLEHRELDSGVGNSLKTLLHYAIIFLGLLLALGLVGFDLSSFALIAGALGVGIGFGLQNIVNNFVSGLILLFERPVRMGDVVVLGGEWGTVQKIGLRSTVVQTFNRSEIIVPNSDLISEKVTNWTLSNPVARAVLPIGVAYGSDVPKVFRILREVAVAHPRVLAEPEPAVHFVGFGDSSLNFEARLWVESIDYRLDTISEVLSEVDRRFRAEGVEIPFPQRDLHLRSVDEKARFSLGRTPPETERKDPPDP